MESSMCVNVDDVSDFVDPPNSNDDDFGMSSDEEEYLNMEMGLISGDSSDEEYHAQDKDPTVEHERSILVVEEDISPILTGSSIGGAPISQEGGLVTQEETSGSQETLPCSSKKARNKRHIASVELDELASQSHSKKKPRQEGLEEDVTVSEVVRTGSGTKGKPSKGKASKGKAKKQETEKGKANKDEISKEEASGAGGNYNNDGTTTQTPQVTVHIGYNDKDKKNTLPPFTPCRPVGIHFEHAFVRSMNNELGFFKLFFTPQMLEDIAEHTNTYAYIKVAEGEKQTYTTSHGSWVAATSKEIEKLIALQIYTSLVKIESHVEKYWSVKTLYHGLWAREILSRDRYKALMAFLHIVNPVEEDSTNKLHKVESFVSTFRERCKLLYQPSQNIAVDERMVKSRHRSGIKQFMKDKPTKWGVKLWVLADSSNGYTCDFEVYAGKKAGEISEHGLGYDVVTTLVQPYYNQGYHCFFDNFYTSTQLVEDLFNNGTLSTGTVRISRASFPEGLKDVKQWKKGQERGAIRWVRKSNVLALQWIDCKPVSILTTIDSANEKVTAKRRSMKGRKLEKVEIPQPYAIHRYNQYMNAVDRSDQLLSSHNVARKCYKWWKVIYSHLIDMAIVNGYLLFQEHRKKMGGEALKRPRKYGLVDFKEALVRQICGFPDYDAPPASETSNKTFRDIAHEFGTAHIPRVAESGVKRVCVVCSRLGRGQKQVRTYCSAPQCQKFLHIHAEYDCFEVFHNGEFKH